MYQTPYAVMVPILNDDSPYDYQSAFGYKKIKHGPLNKPMSLQVRPTVEMSAGVFQACPKIGTQTTTTLHHGIYLGVQRGGAGYVFDMVVMIEATFAFFTYDGADS